MSTTRRIAIVGVGQVGGAAAYALILGSTAIAGAGELELLLVDNNIAMRDAQVRDLTDVAFVTNKGTRVRAATYREAGQCDLVVVTAGSRHTVGQSHLDSANRNTSIVRNVVDAMAPLRPSTILLIVSNPVDLLTTLALQVSQLPPSQVLGAGTFLQSARLRGLMAERVGIAPNSIDIHTLGVDGPTSQLTAWGAATIAGVPLSQSLPNVVLAEIQPALEREAAHLTDPIVRAKGCTPFGTGSAVASICTSILGDRRNVRTVSYYREEYGCCLSMPAVLGREGIVRTIEVPLGEEERRRLAESAEMVKRRME
ncbi:L-lactate dehydrogenase [Podospora aff. communis PSN243]|uniref:L-lactate dehydrogenase n=1 Tax=Podospora aff. communis PSN243 TaxID=3040156 RepID=A0AAV9G7Y3_9PEZI|nr:L-lactate dehydrogenase [Podospora aff. communis PSN243]